MQLKFFYNISKTAIFFLSITMPYKGLSNWITKQGHELLIKVFNSASICFIIFFYSVVKNFHHSAVNIPLNWNTVTLHCESKQQLVWCSRIVTHIHKILYSGCILWILLTTLTLNKRAVLQPFFNWNANYINGQAAELAILSWRRDKGFFAVSVAIDLVMCVIA